MSNSKEPHDGIVKFTLYDKLRMSEFLSDVLVDYLPAPILDDLILSEAVPDNPNHMGKKLNKSYSDILFIVPRRSGGSMGLYFLLEHKSTYDEGMPLQILRDMTSIYARTGIAQHPIIGILLYHGGREWGIPFRFQESLGFSKTTQELYGRFNPDFEYVPIRVREDNLIERVRSIRIQSFLSALLIPDAANQDEAYERFLRISSNMRGSKDDLLFLDALLFYAEQVYKGKVRDFLKKVGNVMNIGLEEIVSSRGHKLWFEGLAEGRTSGLAEGRTSGVELVARNLIKGDVSVQEIMKFTGLSIEQLQELGLKQT